MDVIKTFRHEVKYRINHLEMLKIRDKLQELMIVDQNVDGYMVRSLYFDSINDIDYYDKLSGVGERKKIRLRIYNDNPSKIKLEIKNKYDVHQLKESLIINQSTARELIKGNYDVLLKLDSDISIKIYEIMKNNCYLPKCIVEYDRLAFRTNTTTRITLDYNIKKSNDYSKFLEGNINYLPLINHNEAVLEIKYDRFLEPYIEKILNKYISNNESVSKYVMSRNLEE